MSNSNDMPKRIQRKRTKGYQMPDGAKSVARPSRWGNPYRVEDCESRAACLEKFEAYVQRRLREDPEWLTPLRGHDLACYCALDEQCHADVLLRYANMDNSKHDTHLPTPPSLEHEVDIEWDEPIENLDYVRVAVRTAGTRQRGVSCKGIAGRRVGYAVLSESAPNSGFNGMFDRRVFYLKKGDRDSDPKGSYEKGSPFEAADPRTIKPGEPGRVTHRVDNGVPYYDDLFGKAE